MFKSYTNRGRKWEWLQSWWMLFTIAPFGILSGISFLYAGITVRNKKWVLYSVLYPGAFALALQTPDSGLGALIALFSWMVAIIHVIIIRKVFLIELDLLKEMEVDKKAKIREEAKERFAKWDEAESRRRIKKNTAKKAAPQTASKTESEVKRTPPPIPAVEKIDLNTATEAEIASIPAIGLILAKRIVSVRQEIGGFKSFEQFETTIGIKQHTAEKIKHRVEFSQMEKPALPNQSGRLVDY
ncbi:helix-hairpin-helix domain-containing protein [Bacillus sp. JJ1533]|uniref:ComEA family DNA-binding protein n=1 Tax=Bacillus sp. JJ1533 TaxID=3122959 RepID=UPI002FFF61C3